MQWLYLLTIIAVLVQATLQNAPSTLRHVHAIWRHGNRAPITLYPTDPNGESNWPFGLGKLTLTGMRQQFGNGQFMRNRYNGFISPNLKLTEIYLRSTDLDRTINSAQANIAGLYRPSADYEFDADIPWIPVPVHVVPAAKDGLLVAGQYGNCPTFTTLQNQAMSAPWAQQQFQNNIDLVNTVNQNSGLNLNSLMLLLYVQDPVIGEKLEGLPQPAWITDELWADLSKYGIVNLYWVMEWSPQMFQLTSGPLITQLVADWTQVINNQFTVIDSYGNSQASNGQINEVNTNNNGRKLTLWSAHDVTVSALWWGMGVQELIAPLNPPFAAMVLVELHQDPSGFYYVEFYYRNGSHPEDPSEPATKIELPGCPSPCQVEDFQNYYSSLMIPNWTEACNTPPSKRELSEEEEEAPAFTAQHLPMT